jgi:hypothetical protein
LIFSLPTKSACENALTPAVCLVSGAVEFLGCNGLDTDDEQNHSLMIARRDSLAMEQEAFTPAVFRITAGNHCQSCDSSMMT